MSWSDPIVDEVRRARDAYAARFNYDLRAIFHDLKEKEKCSGRQVVSYTENAQPKEEKGTGAELRLDSGEPGAADVTANVKPRLP